MHNHIEDGHDNSNNRFAVAAGINQMIADDPAPFWGCPKARQSRYLSMRQPRGNLNSLFPEFRLAEQGNASHSVWKLMYAGSVGSQVMMGLPYLYRLITDKALAKASKVWPFETGLKSIHEQDLSGVHIVHAEIYPSLFEVKPAANMVKDELQVRQLAQYFAEQDKKGTLGQLFAGRRTLMNEQRQIVEREEGWILGI
jgi:precorrin-8X/cobalt-precorrin-8 methylmutase